MLLIAKFIRDLFQNLSEYFLIENLLLDNVSFEIYYKIYYESDYLNKYLLF